METAGTLRLTGHRFTRNSPGEALSQKLGVESMKKTLNCELFSTYTHVRAHTSTHTKIKRLRKLLFVI